MPCRRKLHILRFAFRGKSSVVPLLLLSPPNPLRWALAGPLLAAPLNPPGVMFWRKPDVLCAYHLAMVRVTRLRRLRCREANTLGVRSAYPLASACCAPKARLQHRRRKCPWGTLPWKIEIPSQPPDFRLQITPVILKVQTISPHYVQYNRDRRKQCFRQ